jgi:pantetheine hydrolase
MGNSLCPLLSIALLHRVVADRYVGAVAQHAIYYGNGSESLSDLVQTNILIYERGVEAAAKNGAQIISFPEFGLVPVKDDNRTAIGSIAEKIPDADGLTVPCDDPIFADRIILTRSSCMARENHIVVMVNMVDWIDCDSHEDSNCPSDGHYQITTDVLFDEQGRLAAKYHKSHEWPGLKPLYDQPTQPSQVTYKSSFGVEFGLFICFDIMFNDPPVVLVNSGVKHFLYAVKQGLIGEETLISGFSRRHNITLLSANLAGVVHDCSGVIVNGETLPYKQIMIDDNFPEENVILSTIQF